MTPDEILFLATLLAALCTMIGAAFLMGHHIGYNRGRWDKVGPLVAALFKKANLENDTGKEAEHGQNGRTGQSP